MLSLWERSKLIPHKSESPENADIKLGVTDNFGENTQHAKIVSNQPGARRVGELKDCRRRPKILTKNFKKIEVEESNGDVIYGLASSASSIAT